MMTRYQLTLRPDRPCRPQPEWGYRLYAALLEQAPGDFGKRVHEDAVTPLSQFLDCREDETRWTVTLLGEETEGLLGPLLEGGFPLTLHRDRVTLTPTCMGKSRISDPEELFFLASAGSARHQMRFRTAAAFKSRGQYRNMPTTRLILQSLIKKWNGCFPECPIEDEDGQGLDAMADGLLCRHFWLKDTSYSLKGSVIPGFTGELTLENRLSGFHRTLADALLLFSGYAGVGIKTTLGMGGVEHKMK